MNTARQNWKSSARRHHGRVSDGASKGVWIFDRTRGCRIYAPNFTAEFGELVEFDFSVDGRGRQIATNVTRKTFRNFQTNEGTNDDQPV
jgi:hypothetical protein